MEELGVRMMDLFDQGWWNCHNPEKLRATLAAVETLLKNIVGEIPYEFFCRGFFLSKANVERVRDLILTRCFILDKMFRATDEDVKRFRQVNDLLLNLTNQMYRRTNSLYRQTILCADKDFDDDYEAEGALMIDVDYEKEDVCNDILQLTDDNYFGSDFSYMINLIGESEVFHSYSFGRNIEECNIHHREGECKNELDDGVSWAEGNLCNPAFNGIVICHAVHSICNDHPYSIPDLLRINSYWVDVKITCQHITDQRGRRYKDL